MADSGSPERRQPAAAVGFVGSSTPLLCRCRRSALSLLDSSTSLTASSFADSSFSLRSLLEACDGGEAPQVDKQQLVGGLAEGKAKLEAMLQEAERLKAELEQLERRLSRAAAGSSEAQQLQLRRQTVESVLQLALRYVSAKSETVAGALASLRPGKRRPDYLWEF